MADQTPATPLGRTILDLNARPNTREWVPRRFEKLTALDERTVTREITFYIDFSRFPAEARPLKGNCLVVPLHRLERSSHAVTIATTDRYGELGRPTMKTERSLVVQGLEDKWREKLIGNAHAGELLASIARCVTPSRTRVPKILNLGGLIDPGRSAILDARDLARSSSMPEAQVREFVRDLTRWQDEYLLLIEIPTEWLVDERIIVTLRYNQDIQQAARVSLRTFVGTIRKLLGGSVSFGFNVSANRVADAQSGHISLSAPAGFRVIGAALRVNYRRRDDGADPLTVWYRDDDRLPTEAHVHVDTEGRSIQSANFMASFYAYKTGYFLETLIASWILFGIMQVFYDRMSEASVNFNVAKAGLDSELTAALILLLPAVVVTLITQRDSHRVASRSFALVRVLLAASAVASLAAAAMLALRASPEFGRTAWFWCWLVTLVVAARLTLGALVHWWRSGKLRMAILSWIWFWEDTQTRKQLRDIPVPERGRWWSR
jgi:hypothetical protein